VPSRPSSEARPPGGRPVRTATGAGPRARQAEQGSVTAETAVLLPGLAALLAVLLAVLGQGLDHVRATDAARSAARLLARGEPAAPVMASTQHEAPPGSRVQVVTHDGLVVVTVTSPGRALAPGVHLPEVRAEAAVAVESEVPWLGG
jgi:hypothetical protein